MAIAVQRIRPAEWRLLRELRLRSLEDSPEAFGRTLEDAAGQPDDEWIATARSAAAGDRRAWFIARGDGGKGVGMVQARRRPPHDCLLFSMWVAPEERRLGVGRALVDTVEEWGAAWGATRVVLWVRAGNEIAHRFYDRIGFRVVAGGADAESGRAHGAFAMERARS